ncbi:metallopeptidase family protein [Gardnerella vaginalis]|uniref:metallopeptidase family protein n=1 Tax=Gardnerella vaginalis TaxID=2702 RepID=UPI0039EF4B2C
MTCLIWEQKRYRNRHGRGMRAPMFGTRLPRYRTASGMFDSKVAGQIRRLNSAWSNLIKDVQFAVEDVPPSQPVLWENNKRIMSQAFPSSKGMPKRIVLYRLPLCTHVTSRAELQYAIRDEIVQRLAELYGRRPEEIDPDWGL